MSTLIQSASSSQSCITSLSSEQVLAWIRGLSTIAWADGHFEPEEQEIILPFLRQFSDNADLSSLTRISGLELAQALGSDPEIAENFLRTAVMVAIADGIYSFCEDEVLFQFAQALNLEHNILKTLRTTICVSSVTDAKRDDQENQGDVPWSSMRSLTDLKPKPDVLNPLKDWMDGLKIHDPHVAHFLCRMIPPQCPFERDITLFGHKVVHIPPLCKLNPLYEQLVSLRFRALSYLADDCHEDISQYC